MPKGFGLTAPIESYMDSGGDRTWLEHQRKHQRRHRRFRLHQALWLSLLLLVILAAVIGGCIVFLQGGRPSHVEGNERYTADQIIEAAGVRQGDNMYLLNKFKMIDQIKEKLHLCG